MANLIVGSNLNGNLNSPSSLAFFVYFFWPLWNLIALVCVMIDVNWFHISIAACLWNVVLLGVIHLWSPLKIINFATLPPIPLYTKRINRYIIQKIHKHVLYFKSPLIPLPCAPHKWMTPYQTDAWPIFEWAWHNYYSIHMIQVQV